MIYILTPEQKQEIEDALGRSVPVVWTNKYQAYRHVDAIDIIKSLKPSEPVATRNGFSGVIEVEWGKSVPIGTKLYALGDEK